MSGKSTMKNFKAMLADARLPEREVPVCLRGDLAADHESAEAELQKAQKAGADSLAGSGVGDLADRIEALEAEMAEHTYPFRLRALPKPKFRALVAEHPPRQTEGDEAHEADDRMGFNVETFYPALIRASVIDPELDDAEWAELLDEKLTDSQFSNLGLAALLLNTGEISVPFSLAASRAKRASAAE